MRSFVFPISLICAWAALFLLAAAPAGAMDQDAYVGSDTCAECHLEQYNLWHASGHPFKLRKAERARHTKLPLPPGYTWDDISYVIGGANWKARFIDKQGYIITAAKDGSEAKTQYNLEDGSWSFYHKGEKKPYTCGTCHTTGYSKEGHQDGLPGLIGTWAEPGIGCEACHGPGSRHSFEKPEPTKATIEVDTSAELCGTCHQRGGQTGPPPAKGGFIRHHEQINELLVGPHDGTDCVECHEPHTRAITSIREDCTGCHDEAAYVDFARTDLHGRSEIHCIECHMPEASKSAIAKNKYRGDVRSHIVKINVDPAANMFRAVKKGGKTKYFAEGFVTLEYTCLACHLGRDKAWAAKNAKNLHGTQ